ncbi:MAG TPA: DUF4157 domain-containing protein [Candidatus Tectomicrobia bacterium]
MPQRAPIPIPPLAFAAPRAHLSQSDTLAAPRRQPPPTRMPPPVSHELAAQPARTPPTVQRTPSRSRAGVPGRGPSSGQAGVIQANVRGGVPRLHLALPRVTRPEPDTASRQTPRQPAASPAAVMQAKAPGGVESFPVALRPKGGGMPLPEPVRAKMEEAFSADFSDVRVHVGSEATAIGAIAYTWGTHIHFAPGHYNPWSQHGQEVLGHELWHVVQQKAGRVRNPYGSGVAVVQDHALEAEADRMGRQAAQAMQRRRGSQSQAGRA